MSYNKGAVVVCSIKSFIDLKAAKNNKKYINCYFYVKSFGFLLLVLAQENKVLKLFWMFIFKIRKIYLASLIFWGINGVKVAS